MGNQKPALFGGTVGIDDIIEILDRMKANCRSPATKSEDLWSLRRKRDRLTSEGKETMLEKAVAMLADNGHMPGWFNQCPVASGIGGSNANKRSCVDLVHWSGEESRRLTLVELKWGTSTPTGAVQQILRYGAVYLMCRMHPKPLRVVSRRAMSATHVALRVVAPRQDYHRDDGLRDCFRRARESHGRIPGRTGLSGLSMSLDAQAFPKSFGDLPFKNGDEVRDFCDRPELSDEGRSIVSAFGGLTSYPFDEEGMTG